VEDHLYKGEIIMAPKLNLGDATFYFSPIQKEFALLIVQYFNFLFSVFPNKF